MDLHWHHRHRHEECDERELLLLILDGLVEIDAKLDLILAQSPPPDAVSGTITFEGESMSDITLPAGTTTVNAVASYLDANSNAITPTVVPVWTASDPSVGVDTSADPAGLSAVLTFPDAFAGTVSVEADVTNADGTVAQAKGSVTIEAAVPTSEPVSGDIAFS